VHEEDNSYDVLYDDGDEEFEVKEVFLRKPLTRKKSATTGAAAPVEEGTATSSVKAGHGVGARASSTGIDRPGESSYMAPSAADVMSGRVVNQSNDDVTDRKKKGLTGSETWMSNKEYWAKQDEERRNAAKVRSHLLDMLLVRRQRNISYEADDIRYFVPRKHSVLSYQCIDVYLRVVVTSPTAPPPVIIKHARPAPKRPWPSAGSSEPPKLPRCRPWACTCRAPRKWPTASCVSWRSGG